MYLYTVMERIDNMEGFGIRKRYVFTAIIMLLFMLCAMKIDAKAANVVETKTEGDITWTMYDDGLLNIQKATNADVCIIDENVATYNVYSKNIKKVVIESGVTSIGSSAFSSFYQLASITIPNSVSYIGNHAFAWCDSLTNITIPNSVTSFGIYAFSRCKSLKSITIPNGVTEIDTGVFEGCRGLTSITIPNTVTSIERDAFSCCGLTSITIPDSVEIIWSSAFSRCDLTSITIPSSVKYIADYAFSGCSNLKSITIPNSVSIGEYVFSDCSSLTSVTVHYLNEGLFSNCSSLTSVTIPNSWIKIDKYAFSGCSSLTSITIPDSVTEIGANAFSGSGLTSITIPNSVTEIGEYAFAGCSGLTSITIPNSVTKIGKRTFYNCSNLTSITIPGSVTEIGEEAFLDCNSIKSVTAPMKYLRYFSKNIETFIISDEPTTIDFSDYNKLKSITIPNSVTSIGDNAFYGCSSLTSITIPASVTEIGNYAFEECSGLTSITIPDSVTFLGTLAFSGCSNLKSITMPNSLRTIGSWAFKECRSLTSITIPNTVTFIGGDAFVGCNNLIEVSISNLLLNTTDISESFLGTPWLLTVSSLSGSAGDLFYQLDKDFNLSLTGSGQIVLDSGISAYKDSVKTISISSGTTNIKWDSNDEWISMFPNVEKVVNNSGAEIKFENTDDYTWCNSNDLTEPIYKVSKGIAVKVNHKLAKHYRIKFNGNGATKGDMADLIVEVDKRVHIPKNIFTKKGYKFRYWTNNINNVDNYSDEGVIFFSLNDVLNNNIDTILLTAQWEDDFSVFTASFDGNGANSGIMNETVFFADNSNTLPQNTFIKKGYKFKCWEYFLGNIKYSVNAGKSICITEATLKDSNTKTITFKAQWEKEAEVKYSDKENSGNKSSVNRVSNITLNKKSASLVKGKTLTLKPTIKPRGVKATYKWKSSNKKVATVNKNGVVKGVKKGTAIIIVTAGGKQATCKITVTNPVKVKGIKFKKKAYNVKKGMTVTLKTTFTPKNATNQEVTYKSSDKKIATVDKNGKVKGKKKGKVTITVTTKDGKKTAKCTVNVK